MPPAFMGAGIGEPMVGPEGERIGRILDGKGLALEHDLKTLGITKPIPYVFEHSPVCRLLERLGDERAAISSYNGILQARANGKADDVLFVKGTFALAANAFSTTFRQLGVPGVGTYTNIPGGAVLDRTNAGALSSGFSNPTGTDSKYLLTFGYMAPSNVVTMSVLVDQLVAAGNISATTTGAQTVSSTALTRYTSGAGVYATLDVTTALGASASNLTMSYTNQGGSSGQTSISQAMTASAIASQLQPTGTGPLIQLAGSDFGVQAVASVTLSANMGAGALAIILYKPLLWMPGVTTSKYGELDASTSTIGGLVQLQTASGVLGCLNLFIMSSATSAPVSLAGAMRAIAG